MDNQKEIAYTKSIGHMIDDVTWPWKVKVVTQKCLGSIISKTTGDRLGYNRTPIWNGTLGVSNGHMTDDVGEVLIVTSECLGAR